MHFDGNARIPQKPLICIKNSLHSTGYVHNIYIICFLKNSQKNSSSEIKSFLIIKPFQYEVYNFISNLQVERGSPTSQ